VSKGDREKTGRVGVSVSKGDREERRGEGGWRKCE
jgi:hypothetical protein